jgi:hypothetical protein
MKGAVACALAASLDYLKTCGGKPKGAISFLITGDEEGVAVNGTIKLLQWAAERGEKFDHCILGEPSNVERLDWLYGGRGCAADRLSARAVTDDEIRAEIAAGPARWGQVWCPHTATAVRAWDGLDPDRQTQPWVLVATAHPAKFETVVEPLVGKSVAVPPALAALLELPARAEPLRPDLDALRAALLIG